MDKTKLILITIVILLIIVGVFLIYKPNNHNISEVDNSNSQSVAKTEQTQELPQNSEVEKEQVDKQSLDQKSSDCTPAVGHDAGTIKHGDTTYNIVAINSQEWLKENLNIGTMADPSDNNKIEKWCYQDNETNCAVGGALYSKDEAMQYSDKEGAQGICPSGWHIPTDNDWKNLEASLCMAQEDIDNQGWRGEDQGTQIKIGGTSGFDAMLAGYRADTGKYYYRDSLARFLSSTQEDGYPLGRDLRSNKTGIFRGANTSISGYSVRCIKD